MKIRMSDAKLEQLFMNLTEDWFHRHVNGAALLSTDNLGVLHGLARGPVEGCHVLENMFVSFDRINP